MERREGAVCFAIAVLFGCSAVDELSSPTETDTVHQAVQLAPILPVADTTLRAATPFASYGTNTTLGVTTASIAALQRSLLRFDQTAIASAVGSQALYSARIELTVSGISVGWLGGQVEIMPMTRTWPEGNGLAGHGPSWVCADDTNTTVFGNLFNNCSAADNWGMLPTDPRPQPFNNVATDRAPIFTGGLNVITLDVTRDVQRFLNGQPNHGWIIAGTGGPMSGEWVNFASRETTSDPRLMLEVGPDQCPGDAMKGAPGQCGCGVPDTDANFDGVADCFDAVVQATGDTTVRLAVPFANDGTGALLGVTSASIAGLERALVQVDQAAINAARAGRRVEAAHLELTIAGIALGWGGGLIEILPMTRAWPEGNGLAGHGPSWFCADDQNTTLLGNLFNDCLPGDNWAMEPWQFAPIPFSTPPTDTAQLFAPGTTSVRFDVTADVQRYIDGDPNYGWIIKGTEDLLSGEWVNFGSRQSGAPPVLLLDLETDCPDTPKSAPGQCGCGTPDTDSDSDGVADCNDECPFNNQKTERGQCGCDEPETDTDGDSIPDCIDPCPFDSDPTLGGQCGCPSSGPSAAGTACSGVCGPDVCDGAGHCGNSAACVPDPACGCVPYMTTERIYWYCACNRGRDAAEAACNTTPDQTLVRIDTQGENDWLVSRIAADTWTGGNDRSTEGQWRWNSASGDDGTRFWNGDETGAPHFGRYANWQDGEPEGGASSNCAALASGAGGWFDDSCGAAHHFFCERALFPHGGSGPIVNPTCRELGYDCDTGDWSTCVPRQTAFPEADPGASLSQCDACTRNCTGTAAECEAACAASCTGSAEPPSGNATCPDLDAYLLAGEEIHCALNTNGVSTLLCESSTECPFGLHCGWGFACSNCDTTAGFCPQCVAATDCGLDVDGREAQCVAYKACGIPVPECLAGDAIEDRCDETALCEIEFGEHDPAPPPDADLEPDPFEPADVFGEPEEPQDNVDQYPNDPPCDASPCAATEDHKWCHYAVTEDLGDRAPSNPPRSLDAGSNTPVTFNVSPNLNLNFQMDPGPLGMTMTRLNAGASFTASATVNVLGLQNRTLDLIDLSARIEGGVHPDLCGINTDGTHAIVMGMDLLPADFEGIHEPADEEAAEDCKRALRDFQEVVDRAKKAFHDARELLEQYHALGPNQNLQALCEQYVADPPRGFPPPAVDCALESPEATINRFIDFYVQTTDDVRRVVRDELATQLDDWFSLGADFPIGEGVSEVEEVTILNHTFFIGPIPANLEVLLIVGYGLETRGSAEFRTGSLLTSLLALPPGADEQLGPSFVRVGAGGSPYVNSGVSLFVGVGFDAGFASAKAGVQGSLELGHVTVPVHANAGIAIGTSDDDRILPGFMDGLVDETVPLLPQKKYHYGLAYDLGGELLLRELLSGEIAVKVKVKFFFFSKTWKRRIVKFNGLCAEGNPEEWCDVRLFDFSGGVATGDWDWGTIQMPMPFLALKHLNSTKPAGAPQPFQRGDVAEFFYDSLCTCIPTWDGLTSEEQEHVDDCFRLTDCCDQSPGKVCFDDPADGRAKCTGCRPAGASCNEDDDCGCPGSDAINCLMNVPGGTPGGVCTKLGGCNARCFDDTDCDSSHTCSSGRCSPGCVN